MFAVSFFSTEDRVRRMAAKRIDALLARYQTVPVLLLLSGGSALGILAHVRVRRRAHTLTLTVLDERYGADPAVNNFLQLSRTEFYHAARKNGARCMRTVPRKKESLSAMALRWERMLRRWKKRNPRGAIIATMGIGADGHTAGIMPHPENEKFFLRHLDNPRRWVAGYDATRKKNEHPLRMTTTLPFLRAIDHAIVFAVGAQKKYILQKIARQKGTLRQMPARIIHDMQDVCIFTDQKSIMKKRKE